MRMNFMICRSDSERKDSPTHDEAVNSMKNWNDMGTKIVLGEYWHQASRNNQNQVDINVPQSESILKSLNNGDILARDKIERLGSKLDFITLVFGL